mmetsp:Transcript_2447/g.4182  ORF Transcript_2447/g.4182 Transcript_2447/m.4182 type:complete len:174 (-) Transcript_2447:100-621(-)
MAMELQQASARHSGSFQDMNQAKGSLDREQSFASTQTGSAGTTEASPDPNCRGTFHSSTRDYKRKMMVKAFLQANGFLHVNEPQHSWGRTRYPLHVAASQNKPAIVQALLQLGARPNVQTRRGLTPEDLARKAGHEDVLNVFERSRLEQESTMSTLPSFSSMASMTSMSRVQM